MAWLARVISRYADVAQLVEHHLAKVRVAGSNPVVRSRERPAHTVFCGHLSGEDSQSA
jgi:spore coat polysaccharide biosynthesis protein SpsF (cytidylyltransferase family)